MAGPDDDWTPVKAASGDDWTPVAKPVQEPEAPPEAFMHRLALGMMIGGSDPSPSELRAKGFEDFNVAANTVDQFKSGLDRIKKGFSDTHSSLDVGMGAFQSLTAPLTAAFQAIGGAGEKATGGVLSGDQINTALMLADGAPGQLARVRNGAAQVIGGLPRAEDFTNAAKVLSPRETVSQAAIHVDGKIYTGALHSDAFESASKDLGREVENHGEGGFVTSSGRYVSRSEAMKIAEAADQPISDTGKTGEASRELSAEQLQVNQNLKQMWQDEGIHPAEAVHDAQTDAFFKNEIASRNEELKPDPETEQILNDTGGKPGSLSAAVNDAPYVPLDVQPASPPGSLIAKAQGAADKLFDIGRDIQMKLAPMARGSADSMATVKDYMNSMRRNAWDVSRVDTDLMKKFTPEQRARMANAMEEESLSLRLGEPASAREHQGLATLDPAERQAVIDLDTRQQLSFLRAKELGMVEGEGVPMHFPRMVTGIPKGLDKSGEGSLSLTATGFDMKSSTQYLKQRKYMELEGTEKAVKEKIGMQMALKGKGVDEINAALENVKVARDIRAVNIGQKALDDAIAGRTLIKNIQDVGKRTQQETVAEGFQPDESWFTVDHPAFKTWRPKFAQAEDGSVQAVKDASGKPVFEQVPIYVRGDFEGPLRSAMWGKSGETYKAMMALKGKTMGLIMYSPAIHNMVELGRAFPALPTRIIKAYFDGYKAKNDVAVMHEAIDSGLVPIGKRFFNQDINAVMEAPDLVPGRGWTAKLAGAIPGLFDEAAGVAVKRSVDQLGDIYHNKLLWDRIADLQMGLYTNFQGDLIGSGMDRSAASRIAAHWANRYAGSLPKEAMGEMATKIANFVFFSRSFTFGNLGVMKDMLTGLPKDVLAQIERDARFKAGSIEGADAAGQQAVSSAQSVARRKAISTVALDIALQHAGNTVFQSALNIMNGNSWSEEEHGYLRRFQSVVNDVRGHPLSLLNPVFVGGIPSRLDATADNEPGKEGRIMIGKAKDGTAIYARNPVGKIGEEFSGYFDGPLDMLRRKEGTVMRPLMQIYSNDAGFGRKIYDPNAQTLTERAGAIGAMVKHLMTSQLPVGALGAAHDLVTGEGDKFVNELQVAGPFAGVTFSKGAPGGPDVGEMYHNKSAFEFRVQQAMPDIRRQILRGDVPGAQQAMTGLGMDASYSRWVVKTTQNPATRLGAKALGDFYRTATPEQRDRMTRIQQAPQPQQ